VSIKPLLNAAVSDSSDSTLQVPLQFSYEQTIGDLSVNIVSTSHVEDEDKKMIQSDTDLWIKHLNTLWDMRFEQREPPTEDKVVQINLRNEANPKPIFISESLSPSEKEDLVRLVQEYIDVFAWNYEDMPGLNPQVAVHCLNTNPDVKSDKQQQRRFYPEIMEATESEVKKLT